jgi:thiol-disulfide isomerase/thioredoxin
MKTYTIIISIIAVVGLGILYLIGCRAGVVCRNTNTGVEKSATSLSGEANTYSQYKEIVNPAGFVNSESFQLADLVGKKVILLDVMTYSCINCQRTYPYLRDWYAKYKDQGLEIVAIHTPEFAFEKDKENVEKAMKKFGLTFPVVLDNDYGTWNAYGNRYWPRKYLIDINGNIIYDHIGEGAYEETEQKIVKALNERAEQLGLALVSSTIGGVVAERSSGSRAQSPETYLGSLRGDYKNTPVGGTDFVAPEVLEKDRAYLVGKWIVTDEYVQPAEVGASIIYPYRAQKVFLVMGSEKTGSVEVYRDGKKVTEGVGESVSASSITVTDETLYRIIEQSSWGEYTLELKFLDTSTQAFAFTFG